jgi:hypothetical protein
MKGFISFVLFAALFGIFAVAMGLSGCTLEPDIRDINMSFSSMEEVYVYVTENVRYKSDLAVHGQEEYWQAPMETLERGTGDCEDFAILVGYFLEKMGYSVRVVGVETWYGSNHAILKVNGILYESLTYMLYPEYLIKRVIHTWSMDDAYLRCNDYGSRSAVRGEPDFILD